VSANAKVIEFALLGAQTDLDVTQTFAERQLGERHAQILIEVREGFGRVARWITRHAAAERMDLRAATINSDNRDEWTEVEAKLGLNEVDILLISPERLANELRSRWRAPVDRLAPAKQKGSPSWVESPSGAWCTPEVSVV
jgi:hypothetical protein